MRKFLSLFLLSLAICTFAQDVDWKTEPLRITAREDSTTIFIICHIDLDKHISVTYDVYSADNKFKSRYLLQTSGAPRWEGDNMEKKGYIFFGDTAQLNPWVKHTLGEEITCLNKDEYILVYGYNPNGIGSGTFTKERHLTMNIPSGKIDISGNIMSLLVGKNSEKLDTANYIPSDVCFARLFNQCPDARDPIVDTLTTGPVDASNMILPATTLRHACYDRMFNSCNLLEKFPELPATDMGEFCYLQMFGGCIAATLPPKMAATELYSNCCRHMFQNCYNLQAAAEIPATELVPSCYYGMYDGCSSLNEVKVKFTDWIEGAGTGDWLLNVASSGTFYCPKELAEEFGTSFIPEGWEVVFVEEPSGIKIVSKENTNISRKLMINGQIYILRDGVLYDINGRKL